MLLRALPRALLFRGKLHHRLIDLNMAAPISTSSAASSARTVKEPASIATAGVLPAGEADRVFRVTGQPGPPLTEAAATAGELPVSSKSLWIAMHQGEVPRFPQLVGDGGEFDVVVVGAGIVGLSAAYTLSRSGYKVAVVEGSRVASGVTSFSTSKITGQHKAIYHTMSTDNARRYWRMNEAGMAVVQDAVQRYDIDCNLQSKPHNVYVWTDSMVKALRQEYDAAIAAGIPGVELATAATAGIGVAAELPASMGVKARLTFPGQMQLNIYSYCIGLVKALAEREGVTFWEDSRVVNVSASAPHVIETKQGRVTGRYCVLGTHLPILDRSLHFSTCEPYQVSKTHMTSGRFFPPCQRRPRLIPLACTKAVQSYREKTPRYYALSPASLHDCRNMQLRSAWLPVSESLRACTSTLTTPCARCAQQATPTTASSWSRAAITSRATQARISVLSTLSLRRGRASTSLYRRWWLGGWWVTCT